MRRCEATTERGSMPKRCAYCGLTRPLTREHIWPDGFLKRDEFGVKFSARAGRTFAGDLVVRDVCATCNNGPLGALDAYACQLYDSNFRHFPEHYTPIRFQFDYGRLTRWLLKVAFNSARAHGHEDAALLELYRPLLLAEANSCPIHANFSLALVGPGTIGAGQRAREVYPAAARSGPYLIQGLNGYQHISTRMLMIRGYFFTLILPRTPSIPSGEVQELLSAIPGEPLALDGDMLLFTSLDASHALTGVQDWPVGSGRRGYIPRNHG